MTRASLANSSFRPPFVARSAMKSLIYRIILNVAIDDDSLNAKDLTPANEVGNAETQMPSNSGLAIRMF